MNDEQHDEAMDRLRAADPAAGAQVDADALRHAVDLRVGGPEISGEEDELIAARLRRQKRRTAWVAAAAVAGLGFGTGGYLLGAAGEDPAAPLPPISLQGAPGGAQEDSAAGTDMMATEATASRSDLSIFWQRAVFTASGLSSEPGRAEAFGFDPKAVYSAETAARIAAVLGMSGEPREEGGAWMVGSWDRQEPVLQIHADGTASLSYNNPALDPYACVVMDEEGADSEDFTTEQVDPAPGSGEGSGSAGEGSDPVSPEMLDPALGCGEPSSEPAPANALEIAQALLADIGVPTEDLHWTVDTFDPTIANVMASDVRGDRLTGLSWNIGVVAGGVYSIWGSLAPAYSLGEYDVISEDEAVERLMDPRFGAQGGVMPLDTVEDAVRVEEERAQADDEPVEWVPTVPDRVEPGSAIGWPVQDVTIVDATLSVGAYYQADGAMLLLPAYELSDSDGQVWTVLAVAESALDLSTP